MEGRAVPESGSEEELKGSYGMPWQMWGAEQTVGRRGELSGRVEVEAEVAE